jgi:hypothetical protein
MSGSKQLKTENDVKAAVMGYLNMYPEVFHHDRLNSGTVQTKDGRYIRLAKSGTPDIFAVVVGKDGNTHLLFIECKAPGKHIVTESPQAYFRDRIKHLKNVHHIEATSTTAVSKVLLPLIYDTPIHEKEIVYRSEEEKVK